MNNVLSSLALLLLTTACTGSITGAAQEETVDQQQDEPGREGDAPPVATTTHLFEEISGDIANPERGFYVGVNLFSAGSIASVRDQGATLAIALVRLDAYRSGDISAAFLDDLAIGFQGARDSGIKVILRFTYNSSFSEDAPREQILAHISQLTPLLQANADVIAVMQAGFIGAWGEWHSSTNGLDNLSDRQAILEALLTALPENRSVQVRTPMFKRDLWSEPTAQPEILAAAPQARVGHHNDCFLASDSDFGTFASPVDDWRDYLSDDTSFVPMGGETCVVNAPRTDCQQAMADMEGFHYSYLNREYKTEVLDAWAAEGCLEEIESRMGYRFVLDSVTHPVSAKAGQSIDIELALQNRGFAAPFNARPAYLVLRGATSVQRTRIEDVDPRQWLAGESNVHTLSMVLPVDMEPGTYSVSLSLPDAAPALAEDPRFAVRFANEGTWSQDHGENLLIPAIVIGGSSEQGRSSSMVALR